MLVFPRCFLPRAVGAAESAEQVDAKQHLYPSGLSILWSVLLRKHLSAGFSASPGQYLHGPFPLRRALCHPPGCLCVQVCCSSAFSCSSQDALARGEALLGSLCQHLPSSDGLGTVLHLSVRGCPRFSAHLLAALRLGGAGDRPCSEALLWHLPLLFHPAFPSLSGCRLALIDFGCRPRNSLSTHTNQEG